MWPDVHVGLSIVNDYLGEYPTSDHLILVRTARISMGLFTKLQLSRNGTSLVASVIGGLLFYGPKLSHALHAFRPGR